MRNVFHFKSFLPAVMAVGLIACYGFAQEEYQVSGDLAGDIAAQGHGAAASNSGPFCGLFGGFCDSGDCCPRWTFAAEAIALQRSTTRHQGLFKALDSELDLLDSRDMEFAMGFGPKVSAIWHGPCEVFDLEVGYWQVDGFTAERTVPGLSVMITDVHGPYFLVTDATARYTSALYNGEINLRWHCLDWLVLFSGFRMGEMNERYRATGAGIVPPTTIAMEVNTFNHLYGYQLGAEMEVFNRGGPLQIIALCKAGAYGNAASQNIRRTADGYSDEALSAVRDQAAFLGEAQVVATLAITKQLAFRASYQAVWLEGVALAPEQIAASDFVAGTATVDTAGGVFYHGAGLGLEYRF